MRTANMHDKPVFVDTDLTAKLSPRHLQRLRWFEEHAGQTLPRPRPLDHSLPLVHPRRGIYKPAELYYATAIVTMLRSRYEGDRVIRHADGTWDMIYHQEDPPADRIGDIYTNTGLHACQRDRIPVGVLQERKTLRGPRMFEVLGLATPVDWRSDYFILQSLREQGGAGRAVIDALLATAEVLEQQAADKRPLPTDDYDARLRSIRQIVARQGQFRFRASLLDAYSGRCAITRWDVPDVLEAAHLCPYRGPDSNDIRNGLLLRADIHTLLDLMLLAVNPDTRRVIISARLKATRYRDLTGIRLAEPKLPNQRPPHEILEKIWQEFCTQEAI